MSSPTIRRSQVDGMNIHWAQWSLDEFLDYQARLGVVGIELWGAMPHLWIDALGYYDVQRIRHKIEQRGLVANVLCPENVVSPYQVNPQESLYEDLCYRYFANGIRCASELGCAYMSINSGWGYWNEDREEAWKRSRDILRRLSELAEVEGVILTVEALRPQESHLVVTLADTKRMYD